MQADLCAHHKKIVNRICAKGLCSAIMCSGCFEEHQRSTNHSLAVLLNTSSLDYFLKFLKDIITKLDEILIKIEHAGISMIF